MLERLNGIFAFAVWDDRDKRLFLARDRLGVKPLYSHARDGVFAFASELRSLLPLVGGATLDETALADYLTLPLGARSADGVPRDPRSCRPGTTPGSTATAIETRQYWDLAVRAGGASRARVASTRSPRR